MFILITNTYQWIFDNKYHYLNFQKAEQQLMNFYFFLYKLFSLFNFLADKIQLNYSNLTFVFFAGKSSKISRTTGSRWLWTGLWCSTRTCRQGGRLWSSPYTKRWCQVRVNRIICAGTVPMRLCEFFFVNKKLNSN